jgi:hypothetical protein
LLDAGQMSPCDFHWQVNRELSPKQRDHRIHPGKELFHARNLPRRTTDQKNPEIGPADAKSGLHSDLKHSASSPTVVRLSRGDLHGRQFQRGFCS